MNEEEKLETALNLKRRNQNVFSEAIDDEAARCRVTEMETKRKSSHPSIQKDENTAQFLVKSMQKNFVLVALEIECVLLPTDGASPRSRLHRYLGKLVQYCTREAVEAGQCVIEQGELPGAYFYVVEKGRFEYVVDGVVKGAPRAATVRAQQDSVVWKLDRVTFRSTLALGSSKQKRLVIELLSGVELLQGLTEQQLEAVAEATQPVTYEAKRQIIKKGEKGSVFYMIQDGTVECSSLSASDQITAVPLTVGEYFGERALIYDEPRAADVTALTQVTLLALDRDTFHQVLGPLRKVLDINMTRRVIASIGLFSKLTVGERRRVAAMLQEETHAAGDVIIHQGEDGDDFYVVKSGHARVEVRKESVTTSIKTIGAGAYFGEMSLLNNEPRAASVIAADGPVVCFRLNRHDFTRFMGAQLSEILEYNANARQEEVSQAIELVGVPLAEFKVLAPLGSGTFGRVKLAKWNERTFALKAVHKQEIVAHKQVRGVMNEKTLMRVCAHPFVLKLYSTFEDSYRLYFLLEFLQGGELFAVLHTSTRNGVPEAQAKFYAAAVATALQHVHDKHVAYRDLKPENIMLDDRGYPKIVDFGFAKVVNRKTYTLCGTPEYLAPELVLGRGHDKSVDWWALGILVFESIVGRSPFATPSADQTIICKNILQGTAVFTGAAFNRCAVNGTHVKDFIKSLLQKKPINRLGYSEDRPVAVHTWFNDFAFRKQLNRDLKAPYVPYIKNKFDTANFAHTRMDDRIDANYKDNPKLWAGFV